jgi:hypothetical protein
MVHMAGLRQESWGRRSMMRALGVWQDAADALAPESWVSARALDPPARLAANPSARQSAWTATGQLLLTADIVHPVRFASMMDYDRFAARLLLLGLLLRRRVVFPPIDCSTRYMRKALLARHLRGMEVGCGKDKQCVWLPYPQYAHFHMICIYQNHPVVRALSNVPSAHMLNSPPRSLVFSHIEPWCAGIDFLYDIDYRGMVERGDIHTDSDVTEMSVRTIQSLWNASDQRHEKHLLRSGSVKRVLLLRGVPDESGLRRWVHGPQTDSDQLSWIPLGGFRSEQWRAPFPRRVEAFLRAPAGTPGGGGGLGLNERQITIVKTCLKSLSTSRE